MGVVNLSILIDRIKKTFVKKSDLSTDVASLGFVSNTDYASSSKAGVIKTGGGYGAYTTSAGIIAASARTANQYASDGTSMFIAKGTLENIKVNLLTSAMIDYATNQISAQANDVYAIRLVYDGTDWTIIAQKTN